MIAFIVAFGVLSAWYFIFSLCCVAAPADAQERKSDDEAQIEFLRKLRS